MMFAGTFLFVEAHQTQRQIVPSGKVHDKSFLHRVPIRSREAAVWCKVLKRAEVAAAPPTLFWMMMMAVRREGKRESLSPVDRFLFTNDPMS